jgi:integrase
MEEHKSNEPWALKQYIYDHMLIARQQLPKRDKEGRIIRDKETGEPTTEWVDAPLVANKENDIAVSNLIEPILEWQNKNPDPVRDFRLQLEAGYSPNTAKNYMRIAIEFVSMYGKKFRYTESEILRYIAELKKRYPKQSSFATSVYRLKSFLDSLPRDKNGQGQPFPIKSRKMPKYPDTYEVPMFEATELEQMGAGALLDEEPSVILRLLIAQIYGVRLEELSRIRQKDINLNDFDKPTVTIKAAKRGQNDGKPITQPIPRALIPYFAINYQPANRHKILRDLHRICKKAGVEEGHRSGFHSIRRQTITALFNIPGIKDMNLRRFMRWSTSSSGMLERYVKTPTEVTDADILSQHPFMDWWVAWSKYLMWLPQYKGILHEHICSNIYLL